MIDPHGIADCWVRSTHTANLTVLKPHQTDFLHALGVAITAGHTVLLENIGEELDPSLEFLLQKRIFYRAGEALIRLGSADVQYNAEFELYITTKMSNPQYTPEMYSKVRTVRAP